MNPRMKAKGRRPYFFDDPAVDKLLAIVLALMGELSVTRERLDTVERILASKGQLSEDEIDGFRPDEAAKNARTTMRNEYVARVLRIIANELEELEQSKAEAAYKETVDKLASA
jgi:polyhydroxyalkanoate synthesis regulator phasin